MLLCIRNNVHHSNFTKLPGTTQQASIDIKKFAEVLLLAKYKPARSGILKIFDFSESGQNLVPEQFYKQSRFESFFVFNEFLTLRANSLFLANRTR